MRTQHETVNLDEVIRYFIDGYQPPGEKVQSADYVCGVDQNGKQCVVINLYLVEDKTQELPERPEPPEGRTVR